MRLTFESDRTITGRSFSTYWALAVVAEFARIQEYTEFLRIQLRPSGRTLRVLVLVGLIFQSGCATWLPSGEEPPEASVKHGIGATTTSGDVAGVETILVRLSSSQAERLPDLWVQIDEQALKPELRIAIDKNGMRAGKIAGNTPPLLDEWVRQTVRRIGEDPLEQAGFAADVSSYAQLWRCRANVRKELSVRNLSAGKTNVAYHDASTRERVYDAPHFIYSIQTTPHGDASATIRLTPELEHGDLVKKMVARESAVRTNSRRESVTWDQLAIELRIQQGDYIVIGPTTDSRGLGKHYFHTRTKNGEIQPVLLLVRLSEASADGVFALPLAKREPQQSSFFR